MWNCQACKEEVAEAFDICWNCGTTVDGLPTPNFVVDRIVTPQPESSPQVLVDAIEEKFRCPKCKSIEAKVNRISTKLEATRSVLDFTIL